MLKRPASGAENLKSLKFIVRFIEYCKGTTTINGKLWEPVWTKGVKIFAICDKSELTHPSKSKTSMNFPSSNGKFTADFISIYWSYLTSYSWFVFWLICVSYFVLLRDVASRTSWKRPCCWGVLKVIVWKYSEKLSQNIFYCSAFSSSLMSTKCI